MLFDPSSLSTLGVVPVLVGPLQAFLAILPQILLAVGALALAMFKPSGFKKLCLLLWSQKWVVIPTVGVIFLLIYFAPVLFSASGNAGDLEAGVDWPVWRGDHQRCGVVHSSEEEPASGQVQWRFIHDGRKTFYSSPAVSGNRVYVTGCVPPNKNGAIYAIDADTGQRAWVFDSMGYRATFSSPAVKGKYLVVGEGLHVTRDARVFCLDIQRSNEKGKGVVLWSYQTESHVESSPCIANGKVYVGAGDDGFYCFNLDGDGEGGPEVLWRLKGKEYLDCETSPVVSDGVVYFGLGKGGKAILAVDADTGQPLWRVEAPFPVFGSPAVSDGKVVVGMGIGNYIQPAEDIAAGIYKGLLQDGKSEVEAKRAAKDIYPAGEVWALDAKSGEVLWRFKDVERTILGAPAISDGRVYFGSRDQFVYCLSLADGSLLRKKNINGPIVAGLSVGRKYLYAVTQTGVLYGLDKTQLQLVWGVSLNSSTLSSPAVARGHVYLGSDANGLLCLGTPGRLQEEEIWAGRMGRPGGSGWTDNSQIPSGTKQAWRFTPNTEGRQESEIPPNVTSPPAYVSGKFYFGVQGQGKSGLLRMDANMKGEGNLVLQGEQKWFIPTSNPICISPAATEEAVFFVDGTPGQEGRAVRCLASQDGKEKWRRPVAPDAAGAFSITPERMFIADAENALSCLRLDDGEILWRLNNGRIIGEPLIAGNILFALCAEPKQMLAIDIPTGKILWTQALERMPRSSLVASNGKLWLADDRGLSAYDEQTGALIKTIPCGVVQSPLVCDDEKVAGVTDKGKLVVVNTHDLTAIDIPGDVKELDSKLSPLLAADAILFFTEDGLDRLDLLSGKVSRLQKLYSKWYGSVTQPMLLINSHLFYPTSKRGLVCLKPKSN